MIESKEAGAVEVNECAFVVLEESDLLCGAGFNLVASPDTMSLRIASPSNGWEHHF